MRTITHHHTNDANRKLHLQGTDRNDNGVTECYSITIVDTGGEITIPFQYGPIKEMGVNGATLEVLLAIIRDQLEGYQTSKFKNTYNECALDHVSRAAEHLEDRTREREARNVEGTHEV